MIVENLSPLKLESGASSLPNHCDLRMSMEKVGNDRDVHAMLRVMMMVESSVDVFENVLLHFRVVGHRVLAEYGHGTWVGSDFSMKHGDAKAAAGDHHAQMSAGNVRAVEACRDVHL